MFFLATPEISRMSAEYRRQFDMEMVSQLTEHHDLSGLPGIESPDLQHRLTQGKATWLKMFMKAGSDTIGALEQLLIMN